MIKSAAQIKGKSPCFSDLITSPTVTGMVGYFEMSDFSSVNQFI